MTAKAKAETDQPNLETICRLCLREDTGTVDIFENVETMSIPLRIMACVSIVVQSADPLPKLICQTCRIQLERSYCFQKKCKFADSKLRKHIRLINAGKPSKIIENIEEDDDFDEVDEYRESVKFLKEFEDKELEQRRIEQDNLEEKLKEKFRIEETRRILEDAKNYLNFKAAQQSANSSAVKSVKLEECPRQARRESTSSKEISPRNSQSSSKNIGTTVNVSVVNKLPNNDCNSGTIIVDERYPSDEYEQTFYVIKTDDANRDTAETTDTIIDPRSLLMNDYNSDGPIETVELASSDDGELDHDGEKTDLDMEADYLDEQDPDQMPEDGISEGEQLSIERVMDEDEMSIESGEKINIENKTDKVTHLKVKTKEGKIILMELENESPSPPYESIIQKDVTETTSELKIFKCSECPQSFTRRAMLMRHNSVHLKNKGYSCKSCEKWFACKSSLDRHMRVHTGEKPYECPECHRRFIQKEILKRHMITHTGEKPHKCSECNKTFVQKQHLRQHIYTRHTDNPVIQMHKCHLCPKSFCHASGLSRHLLTHTGITYNCKLCDRKFSDRSAIKRHTLSVHSASKMPKPKLTN